jgi:hypothetical protein
MKKVAALFTIFAVAVTGNALAIGTQSGPYTVAGDQQDAYDCGTEWKWEQMPDGQSGLAAQDDQCYPFLAECADDFMGDGSNVTGVGWWGVFWNGSPVAPDGFQITIYLSDPDGCPGEAICSEFVTDYNQTAGDPYGYCATLAEACPKADGVSYHVSTTAVFCFPPQWGSATGTGNGQQMCFRSAFFGFPDWVPGNVVFGVNYDLAFLLYNDGIVPTEDASWSSIKNLYE